ncbi:MAG: AAA family ATPase [Leptospiraceae bacterium]|nr:AAA family ATPase [Leptospiraceae bacterium]
MDELKKTSGMDFLSVREAISKELGSLSPEERGDLGLPEVFPEKNELKIEFTIPTLTKEQVLDSIQILKSHIENLRIHTFESGYYTIQALNENLFDTKNILETVRFRFVSSRTSSKIEISKKGNYKSEELFAIFNLYKYFLSGSGKKTQNPKELLLKLGISVYDPIEEELKGEQLDFGWIAGYENVKREIKDSIILPIQNPNAFEEISKLTRKHPSRNRPRAVLFEGDPGVGKTTMAKIVSYLCKIPMIYVPIETILSKYYGESSQNLAYVFDAASLFPSSIIFLDEIDSLAGSREEGLFEATRNLLSVLLRKLDGFEGKPGSMTLGATNRKQDLDPALLSRFDKSIYFPLPDLEERTAILGNFAIHLDEDSRRRVAEKLNKTSGRNIKDFCDYVERKWTARLLESKNEIIAPPVELYLEIADIVRN